MGWSKWGVYIEDQFEDLGNWVTLGVGVVTTFPLFWMLWFLSETLLVVQEWNFEWEGFVIVALSFGLIK